MAGPGAQSAAARAGDSGEQVHGQGEHEVPSLQLHSPGPGHHGTGQHLHHRGGKSLLLLSNIHDIYYISNADISVD